MSIRHMILSGCTASAIGALVGPLAAAPTASEVPAQLTSFARIESTMRRLDQFGRRAPWVKVGVVTVVSGSTLAQKGASQPKSRNGKAWNIRNDVLAELMRDSEVTFRIGSRRATAKQGARDGQFPA